MTVKGNPRVAVKIDPITLAKVDHISHTEREFEGNRSLFIRKAVYELVERFEKIEEAQARGKAA